MSSGGGEGQSPFRPGTGTNGRVQTSERQRKSEVAPKGRDANVIETQ